MYSRGKQPSKKLHSAGKSKESGSNVGNVPKQKDKSSDLLTEKAPFLPAMKIIPKEKFPCYNGKMRTNPDLPITFCINHQPLLKRTREQGIGLDELDKLQLELELMLSSVAVRQRTLNVESEMVIAAEDDKAKRVAILKSIRARKLWESEVGETFINGHNRSSCNTTENERSSDTEDLDDEYKEFSISGRHPAMRNIPLVPPSVVPVSRNDTTNKFWAFVETYCAEITNSDIKFLEELLKSYDVCDKDDFMKIHPLGTHFTKKWPQNGNVNEQGKKSQGKSSKPNAGVEESGSSESTTNVMRNSNKMRGPGPTVSRLMCSLVEERGADGAKKMKRGNEENASSSSEQHHRADGFLCEGDDFTETEWQLRSLPYMHDGACFEKSVRRELEKLGMLPVVDDSEENKDEVLTELKTCRSHLSNLSVRNKKALSRLSEKAKIEQQRQAIKNQIKGLNSEIANINMRNMALKLKKKHLCKKDVEDAWRLLKQREELLLKLEETS